METEEKHASRMAARGAGDHAKRVQHAETKGKRNKGKPRGRENRELWIAAARGHAAARGAGSGRHGRSSCGPRRAQLPAAAPARNLAVRSPPPCRGRRAAGPAKFRGQAPSRKAPGPELVIGFVRNSSCETAAGASIGANRKILLKINTTAKKHFALSRPCKPDADRFFLDCLFAIFTHNACVHEIARPGCYSDDCIKGSLAKPAELDRRRSMRMAGCNMWNHHRGNVLQIRGEGCDINKFEEDLLFVF